MILILCQIESCQNLHNIKKVWISYNINKNLYTYILNINNLKYYIIDINPPQKNNLLDIDGPIPVIAISETKFKAKKSKIAVVGCSTIFSNQNLKRNSGNKYLGRNIVRWINENSAYLDIPPTKINQYTLSMTDKDFKKMTYLSILVPAFVVALGFFVSWLRKEL